MNPAEPVAPVTTGLPLSLGASAGARTAVGAGANTDADVRGPRVWLWVALVALLVVAQSALVMLTLRFEATRAQEGSEEAAVAAVGEIRRRTQLALQGLQGLQPRHAEPQTWARDADALLRSLPELGRIERRGRAAEILAAVDSPLREPLFARWPRADTNLEAEAACAAARRLVTPMFSRSQFVPLAGGLGVEVIDVCLPVQEAGQLVGFTVASVLLPLLLEEARVAEIGLRHELSFVEADGTRLARSGTVRGGGVYIADRVVDLPGAALQVRVDAVQRAPSLIPNLATALVLGLSMGLFAVVVLLLRDGRRRARAEVLLAEALAFRKAMGDSLLTGMRARDLAGRIVYANPAFCAMVGWTADELLATVQPPYWPPEQVDAYQRRQALRLAPLQGDKLSAGAGREGHETLFQRRNGEHFPVMIYEAPLVDGAGRHTGWMSAVLELTAQRRAEDLLRQQQERLQATARLASVGEMASLLSHELNQPLSAIASYATGSLNLLNDTKPVSAAQTLTLMHQAMTRIAEQAERAGRVIKSVHDFVRRRHRAHEVIAADLLIESVLPLVRLQARKSGARVEIDVVSPAPRVKVDRTMVEQVLLNLARNGIQAMEDSTLQAARVLTLRVRLMPGAQSRWVVFSVIDAGPGIAPEVARRLFTPFFTTKTEGMGLGLSLCRTVIEQHGGAMDFDTQGAAGSGVAGVAGVADVAGTVASAGAASGTEFRFTLPLSLPRSRPA